MATRCRPGDMALVVRGFPKSLGQSVTCLRLLRPGEPLWIGGFCVPMPENEPPSWLIDPPVMWCLEINGFRRHVAAPYRPDSCLMPIRPERDESFEADVSCGEYTSAEAA